MIKRDSREGVLLEGIGIGAGEGWKGTRVRGPTGRRDVDVEKESGNGRFGLPVLFARVKWRGSRTGQIYDRYRSYGQRATFTPAAITRHYRD